MARVSYRKPDGSHEVLFDSGMGRRLIAQNIDGWPNSKWSIDLSGYKEYVVSGVALAWSEYDPAADRALDDAWQTTYVPRRMLDDGHLYKMQFPVIAGIANKRLVGKIISVQNWKLTGNDYNGNSNTSVNGAAANGNVIVLRSIIAM